MRTLSLVSLACAVGLAWLMYDARLVMNAYAAFGTGGAVVALVGGAMVLWTDDKNSKLFAVGAVTALAGVLVACYAVFFLGGR